MSRKFLGLAIFLWATSLHAQYMPVQAKVRVTAQVIRNGQVVETHIKEGVLYRNSSGSELRRWVTSWDGKHVTGEEAQGALFDKPDDVNYSLDYARRKAYMEVLPNLSPPPTFTAEVSPSVNRHDLGQAVVSGLPCTLRPVYHMESGKPPLLMGAGCMSEQYKLNLKMDFTEPSKKYPGESVRQITELHDIRLGVEPDPQLFDLHSFTVYKPQTGN